MLDTKNPGDVIGCMADPQLKIRAAQATTPDGGAEIRIRDDAQSAWRTWVEAGPEDAMTSRLRRLHGRRQVGLPALAARPRHGARWSRSALAGDRQRRNWPPRPTPSTPAAWWSIRGRTSSRPFPSRPDGRTWKVIDPSIQDDFEGIARLHDGDFDVVNRDTDDQTWLVSFTNDRGPIRYYAWDRQSKEGTFLFVHQSKLEGLKLAPMKPVEIKSRDGLTLHSYLTLPVGVGRAGLADGPASSTAARGAATPGGSTRWHSGSPTAATPASRSTSARSTGYGKSVPATPATGSGARPCTTT